MFKEILSGYTNYFIGGTPTEEGEAKKRAKICSTCPLAKKGIHSAFMPDRSIKEIQGLFCSGCGCPLSPKVRSLESECPEKKW